MGCYWALEGSAEAAGGGKQPPGQVIGSRRQPRCMHLRERELKSSLGLQIGFWTTHECMKRIGLQEGLCFGCGEAGHICPNLP